MSWWVAGAIQETQKMKLMKRKAFSLALICVLLFSFINGLNSIKPVRAIIITVPDDYSTIQEAINVANSGDTIIVNNGTYYEHVVINKTITLQSNERAVINASQDPGFGIVPDIARWIGITIMANYSTIRGFKIVNASNYGIEIRADYCVIQDNIIESSRAGIYAYGPYDSYSQLPKYSPKNNSILNNTVRLNRHGIVLEDTNYNKVDSNLCEKNLFGGILVYVSSSKNTISRNFVSQNGEYGIGVGVEANNNLFFGNTLSKNKLCGIIFEKIVSVPPAYTNYLFHNSFFDNPTQAIDEANYNMWDGGPVTGGNYWNDYNGVDLDGDSFGDTIYEVNPNGTDRYPLLTQPDSSEPVPPIPQAEPIPTPSPEPIEEAVTVLSMFIECTTSDPVFKFEIQGKLRMSPINGIIANVPITLQFSVNGSSWEDITVIDTDENGTFLVYWKPLEMGEYVVRATYSGNATLAKTETEAMFSLATLLHLEPNDFSFFSNSTVTNLSFNSAKEELKFSVIGESGTKGYIDVYVANTLVNNITLLKVYLDEVELNHSSELVDNSWKIHFSYTHSEHSVLVRLNSTIPWEEPEPFPTTLVVASVVTVAVVCAGLLVYFKKRKH